MKEISEEYFYKVVNNGINTSIFCDRQENFVYIMDKLHIARFLMGYNIQDPVCGKPVFKAILVDCPKFLQNLYLRILNKLIDEDGKRIRDRYIKSNLIKTK